MVVGKRIGDDIGSCGGGSCGGGDANQAVDILIKSIGSRTQRRSEH